MSPMRAARRSPEARRRGLTMAGLMARAGVSRATVAHYLGLGLLPAPAKTARNMAYYDPECVERIGLIRELQEKRSLGLARIKELLHGQGIAGLRRIVAETEQMERSVSGWLSDRTRSVPRAALLQTSGLEAEVLDEMEQQGLVARGTEGKYDSVSADLAMAVGRMRRAGLSGELGFGVADLALYRDAIEKLVEAEIRLFNTRVLGRVPARREASLVQAALEGAEQVWVAVRRRVLLEFLERAGGRRAARSQRRAKRVRQRGARR